VKVSLQNVLINITFSQTAFNFHVEFICEINGVCFCQWYCIFNIAKSILCNQNTIFLTCQCGIKQENVSFEVRLPKEGMYKISIYSGRDDEWGDDPPLTSSFRIVCDQLDSQCVPDMAPIDPGIVGWGPGPKALKSGLLMPSHERGKIEVNVKQEVIIQFQVVTHLQVVITMAHNTKTNDELKQYFSYTETSD
jgi:hypothetical protein